MKKLLLSLVLLFSINTQAVVTYMYPVNTLIIGLTSCRVISGNLIELVGETVKCSTSIPVFGARLIQGAIAPESEGSLRVVTGTGKVADVIGRILGFALGTVILDGDTPRLELDEMNLEKLPEDISSDEALAYNENVEELEFIMNYMGQVQSDQEVITNEDIVNQYLELCDELDIPRSASLAFLKSAQVK